MFGALIVKKHPKIYRSRRRFFQLNYVRRYFNNNKITKNTGKFWRSFPAKPAYFPRFLTT